jgi:hydrogenase maturation protease
VSNARPGAIDDDGLPASIAPDRDRPPSILVIGYGNELRGDDALGPLAARAIAEWNLGHVRTLDLHQLTPELAEPLAAVQYALFLDAAQHLPPDTPPFAQQLTTDGPPITGHAAGPQALLRLAEQLYGACPTAYLIAIPGVCFDFGAALSPAAANGLDHALVLARALIEQICQASQNSV